MRYTLDFQGTVVGIIVAPSQTAWLFPGWATAPAIVLKKFSNLEKNRGLEKKKKNVK